MSKRAILVLSVAAAGLLLAGGLYYWSAAREPDIRYSTAPVSTGAVERSVSTSGTVNPVLTVLVGSYVSGVIVGQYCDYNTHVEIYDLEGWGDIPLETT